MSNSDSNLNILVVDDDPSIRSFFRIIVENLIDGVCVKECVDANSAIDLIKSGESFSLIICDFEMEGGNGNLLTHFLGKAKYNLPFIFHTSLFLDEISDVKDFIEEEDNRIYVQKPSKANDIRNIITDLLHVDQSKTGYSKVRISNFIRFNKSDCDIYVRLNDSKYVKIINAGDTYSRDTVEKYRHRHLKYLYIKDSDFTKFAQDISRTSFLSFLGDLDKSPKENHLKTVHEVLHDSVLSVGVDKFAISMAQNYVETVNGLANDENELGKMLIKFKSRDDYLYDHSYMIASVATYIAKKFSWCNDQIIEKLCYASLFHDILLENPKIAMVHDLEDERMAEFSKEEIKAFVEHPQKTVDLLSKSKITSDDLENLIMTHHELPDGTGFPRKINSTQVRRLGCLFIIAHEFVRQLYLHDFDEASHKEIVSKMFNEYNRGNFKEILDGLYKTLELNRSFNL